MTIPSRFLDHPLIVSKLKQTAYGTALSDANLQAGKRFAPKTPFAGQPDSKYFTDRGLAQRGTDFATLSREVERDLTEQLAFVGDSWVLAFLLAMAMGKSTASQPDAGGTPTAFLHTIKPQDPAVDGKDLPVTTIYTEVAGAANLERRVLDCGIKDVSITFPDSAPIEIMANIAGSGRITTGLLATQPALAPLNLLLSNDLVFKYGAQGAPTDITSQIVRGSVKFGFSWTPDEANSRASGGGLFRSRWWAGTPAVSLEFHRFVDEAASTPFDDWTAGTVQEVLLTVAGAAIGGAAEKHQLQIRGLAVVPDVQKIGMAGDKTVYQYTIGHDRWRKEGANDVVTCKVSNLEASFLV